MLIVAMTYGAGLMTGLLHFPDPVVLTIASLAAIVLLHHPPSRLVALVLVIGISIGRSTLERAQHSCAALIPAGEREFSLQLIDPGVGTGRVRVLALSCHGAVTARWPDGGMAPAGIMVRVRAKWTPRPGALGRPDGILGIGRILERHGTPGAIARSRNTATDRIGKLFGTSAPVIAALLIGRMGGIDADLRDQFAQSGLIHILSISGFHVGIVVGWVVLLFGAVGAPRPWGVRAGALCSVLYAAWLGWPAPVSRAAAMLVVATGAHLLQRRWRPDAVIGMALLAVQIIDPWVWGRVGAWLSFVAIAGVVWSDRWAKRWWPSLHPIVASVVVSGGATLATAPIGALLFGQVAVVGVVLNVVAIPLAAVIVPAAGLAVLMASILPAMALALAASTSVLLTWLIKLGEWGSGLPGAATPGEPGIRLALPWIALLLLVITITRGRTTPRESLRRLAWVGALFGILTLVSPGSLAAKGDLLRITFLSVGQGDAMAIRTPHGQWIVIDAGPRDDRFDAGRKVLLPYLKSEGARSVALFVLSHGHRDHAGGAASLFASMPVGLVLDPADPAPEPSYHDFLRAVITAGAPWRKAEAGERFRIDGVELRVLHPTPGWEGEGRDLNEDSIVLEVRYRKFNALLTGDAGWAAEESFRQSLTRVDLIKVGHHGSRTATGPELLSLAQPLVAVISLGQNRYGHPSAQTVARLERSRAQIWRTDRGGAVTLTTNGRTFRVQNRDRSALFDATDP